MKERTLPTNLPHRWYRFYKSRYSGMEVILGVRHFDNPKRTFWMVGIVEEVGEQSLLFKYLDGSFLNIAFDDILKINLYSHDYFRIRGLKDPKVAYQEKLKEISQQKYDEFYKGDKND